jgi:nucleoside-diphosphate-sugar epimerase
MKTLFVFGLGYSATAIGILLHSKGWEVAGTRRPANKPGSNNSLATVAFDDRAGVEARLNLATHVLLSIPPGEGGDEAWRRYAGALHQAANLRWLGYLSTIGVYGDHGGGWVDENTPAAPVNERSIARLNAEAIWAGFARSREVPLDIFRLAGIYGPGRNPLDRVRKGQAVRIVKPGQVFNRIHVDDIAQAVAAAMQQDIKPPSVRIFNLADDEPSPPQDVLNHAARLAGVAEPPEVPYEEAGLSGMARSFYEDNRRVRNDKLKRELGIRLKYPTYREGLAALLKEETALKR